jgi:hypothetical protein
MSGLAKRRPCRSYLGGMKARAEYSKPRTQVSKQMQDVVISGRSSLQETVCHPTPVDYEGLSTHKV